MSGGATRTPNGNGHASTTNGARACLDLGDRPDAARAGRHFVEEQVRQRLADHLLDDAALVAAELLANARQHGASPVVVCVSGAGTRLRIEVRDASPRSPVRPSPSLTNMTGRGLSLVEAVTSRWGVERDPSGGKVVWAEFDAGLESGEATADDDLDAILAAWGDDEPDAGEQRFEVVLGDVPTDLLLEAKAHIDNLVREFSLAGAAGDGPAAELPDHLVRLITTVVHGFSDARDAIKRQALAAARDGAVRTRLVLSLPLSAADAGEAYLAALDDADEYSRAARLLTLETPPDHRLFRRWYVNAVVQQLRQVAAGHRPQPVTPFEDHLVGEIRRLSVLQRVSERAARLQRVTAALARARTPEDVAAVVVSEGVEAMGASGGGLLVPAGDGEHVAVPGVVGYDRELVESLREERLDAPLPAATALRTGASVWLESQEDRDRQFPALRGFESATVSMCAVPLLAAGRTIGALRFSFTGRKLFDQNEREFVEALAALTAQTLQRTETYQAEREDSLALQRALLPSEGIAINGWDIATYYSPAGDEEAGGDFYDVLPVGRGRIAAVVGDVMGRGVEAAAAMAQIRSTIRAYAVDDADPVSIFTRVDHFFDVLNLSQLVTALYFLADESSDLVHVASAGHLRPLLIDERGSRLVETAGGTPFGVGGFPRELVTFELPRGSALVAVTDGLVERRGEDIDEGVQRLIDATAGAATWSAQQILDHVVARAAAERTHDDDVTVLVLRRH
ncbi:MAG TPA: SpoIIE family protein phosphatase [Mycobacteriales bacterium]|nr:SpoIIE family protein phosphatase [Mycobacteriales bacterium]